MKLNKNYSLRKIGDEYIMIVDQENQLDYTQAISLNETAVYLIENSKDIEVTAEAWAELLTQQYDVSKANAQEDAQKIIEVLLEAKILS